MKKSELHFEITVTLKGVIRRDINYCAFIRSPYTKSGSFVMMRAFLPTRTIASMDTMVGKNQFPDAFLSVWIHGDDMEPDDFVPFYQRTLKVLLIKPDDPITYQEDKMHATLILVHPIIHFLETTNVYNRVHEDMTAYDALLDYEKWLKGTHGDIFNFNHIGTEKHKNSYTYEQMLIKSLNDLNVPNYLFHTYKIHNSPCFYFFDDFHNEQMSYKEIFCHYVNLMNPDSMENLDIYNKDSKNRFADRSLLNTNFLGSRPLTDFTKNFIDKDEHGHRPILNHREMYYDHEKVPSSASVPKKTHTDEDGLHLVETANNKNPGDEGANSTRRIIFTPDGKLINQTIPQSATYSRIYSPDENDLGKQRFKNIQKFYNMAESIEFFEMQNCLPDFPQFGKTHKITSKTHKSTPLNIVNIFIRKNIREHYLYHTAKSMFLRYQR